jgi:IclR family acetate operon transcriptional repressor
MMKTVDKALSLLGLFTTAEPELGLTDVARRAGIDKATALRLLAALAAHGILEQDPRSRRYRLGGTLLRLARVREASFPVMGVMQPVLERLAAETGETAHGSLASGGALATVGAAEPARAMRVYVDPAQPLPFHATASGLAYLAYAPDALADLAAAPLTAFTGATPVAPPAVAAAAAEVRARGYAVSARTLEDEVVGIAAPVFDWSGRAAGAVALAVVASRWNAAAEATLAPAVVAAAVEITRGMGAEPPPAFLAAARVRTPRPPA